jgi:hypothetical protein
MTHDYRTEANAMAGAGMSRVRGFHACPAPASVSAWSLVILATTVDAKHGRPRRTEVFST